MRIRDSGMPDEAYWESLLDVPLIVSRLDIASCLDVAELGCGYGTFTVPVARAIRGTVYTFDVDEAMIRRTSRRAAGLRVVCQERDVMDRGFGVTVDAVLLFNILHGDRPVELLRHAAEALRPGGRVLVIHWQYGKTPRGPSLNIRPLPEQIVAWAADAELAPAGALIELPPWHFGLQFVANRKP
jgi:SAM-dependent methyltransferase